MEIRNLGDRTLELCRAHGWATLETGISRPVPEIDNKQVRLCYFLYRSQVRLPYQMLYEPVVRVTVEFETGEIMDHTPLHTDHPPRLLGRYPHAAVASLSREQWAAIWDEIYTLYPRIIDAFAAQQAASPDAINRFRTLFELTTPPFMLTYYHALNPDFFAWLVEGNH